MTSRSVLLVLGAVVLVATGLVACTTTSDGEPAAVGPQASGARRITYGDHADAFGDLWVSDRSTEGMAAPVVVLIHGGFWRDGFFLDLMDPLIPSLTERGYVVWNIEYRRVGAGGGYPETFQDVAAAIDHLAELSEDTEVAVDLDLDRVAVVGHSAGGHLAAWAAGRSVLPTDAIGAGPVVVPTLAVSQAGVLDLVGCAAQGVGGSACVDLVGASPSDDAARYAETSPTEMIPFDAVVVAVHGEADRIVPPSQSITFVDRALEAGMTAVHEPIPGADHFANLDPDSSAWSAVLDALATSL